MPALWLSKQTNQRSSNTVVSVFVPLSISTEQAETFYVAIASFGDIASKLKTIYLAVVGSTTMPSFCLIDSALGSTVGSSVGAAEGSTLLSTGAVTRGF